MEFDVAIRDLSRGEVEEVMRIADRQLGDDYFKDRLSPEDLEELNQIYRIAETPSGEVVGFCFSRLIDGEEKTAYIEEMHLPDWMKRLRQVAILQTMAVEEKHQRKGVGTKLALDAVDQIRKWDTRLILSEAWRQGTTDHVNVGGIMENLDFDIVSEIENRWEEASYKSGFSCPRCGSPPCTCDAVMFAKQL